MVLGAGKKFDRRGGANGEHEATDEHHVAHRDESLVEEHHYAQEGEKNAEPGQSEANLWGEGQRGDVVTRGT